MFLFVVLPACAWAQGFHKEMDRFSKTEMIRGGTIICFGSGKVGTWQVPPAEMMLRNLSNARVAVAKSQFVVTYDKNMPDSAKIAFQYAVDIWQSILISKVPIRVNVIWQSLLLQGALAATGVSNYLRNFPGAPKYQTWYPISVAEKIVEQELNGTDPDMTIAINPDVAWYMGRDGKTPKDRYDLASTVLHEIAHGVGFTASFGVMDEQGYFGKIGGSSTSSPSVYDWFVENTDGKTLLSYNNNSSLLKEQLTSGGLSFNSTLVRAANKGDRSPLYAPSRYVTGSSISHLDDAVFDNTPNVLMTNSTNKGESVLDPGPITKAILAEIGWAMVYIRHTPLTDSEELNQPITITATVTGDSALAKNPVELTYFVNGSTTPTVLPMTPTGKANEYAATLPAANSNRSIGYFITAKDKTNRIYTVPSAEPRIIANTPNQFVFNNGPDRTPPTIIHSPLPYLLDTQTQVLIEAKVSDDYNLGIDTVYLDYEINGVPQKPLAMHYVAATDTYQAELTFSENGLSANDIVKYRIVARDNSKSKNQQILPASDYFSVTVYGVRKAQETYENNFNKSLTEDFVGTGFDLITPPEFDDAALHTQHPYRDSELLTGQNNYLYQLLIPIALKATDATIRFDEVALVEPSEKTALFGEEDFHDYVVVEGSKDNGKTWMPFEPGYNARDKDDWLNAWNKSTDATQNSTTVGTARLMKARQINMLSGGDFSAGDNVLIRFRMFANKQIHGWGWAIDNLKIQIPAVVVSTVLEENISISPNPTAGRFVLTGKLKPGSSGALISVLNALGQVVYQEHWPSESVLKQEINLSSMPSGVYFVSVQTAFSRLTKRIVVAR